MLYLTAYALVIITVCDLYITLPLKLMQNQGILNCNPFPPNLLGVILVRNHNSTIDLIILKGAEYSTVTTLLLLIVESKLKIMLSFQMVLPSSEDI